MWKLKHDRAKVALFDVSGKQIEEEHWIKQILINSIIHFSENILLKKHFSRCSTDEFDYTHDLTWNVCDHRIINLEKNTVESILVLWSTSKKLSVCTGL